MNTTQVIYFFSPPIQFDVHRADKDRQGKTVLRPFEGTDQVDRQRSVILTHDGLTNQIKAKAQKSEDEKNEIARLEAARVNSILDQVD